ncbi:RsiV family protein [Clostridium senegalense]|uniref:RsiV family protein n=1 Tax=Clostridium senegalense TaxID=1465809 RepID=UPI000288E5D0|nr:RsiV family protein [Clostridium senegalense]
MYYDNIISSLNGIPINQNFYLTNEGVVVFYDLYDIAPYVAGIREFKVPYNIFKYGFKPNLSVKADNIMIKKIKL